MNVSIFFSRFEYLQSWQPENLKKSGNFKIDGTPEVLTNSTDGTHEVLTNSMDGTPEVLTNSMDGTPEVLTNSMDGTHEVLTNSRSVNLPGKERLGSSY